METPSSTTRVTTRSHSFAASNDASITKKIEDSEKNVSKSKQQDQYALIDITNDSPIVGLANGVILDTPLAKQRRSRMKNTPGSGEALLRCQVKTLLLKVEEEVEVSKFSLETIELLEPTMMNESQIQNLSGLASVTTPSVVLQQPLIPQVLNGKNEENAEYEKSISRSLLLDFSDKSQLSSASEECFSELSYEGASSNGKELPTEDDDASSNWSTQVNASIHDGGILLDELCEELNNISMHETIAAKFEGKHTRFAYDSDDEIVKEEVEQNFAHSASSHNILRLKGLPTPKGKHLRFSEEEEGEYAL